MLAAAALIGFSLMAWAFLDAPDGRSGASTGAVTVGVVCALIALTAAIDLVVLAVRSSRGEYRNN